MKQSFLLYGIAMRTVAAALTLVVAGCGSSGGGSGSPSGPSTPSGATTASLTLTIPPATAQSIFRKQDYVSPNSAAIKIDIDNVNGSPTVPAGIPASTTIKLTTGSGGPCAAPTTSGSVCTVSFLSPAGNIVFTFTLLDSGGNALATAKKAFTIVKGQSNSGLSVVLSGIVSKVTILVPSLTSGVPLTASLSVTAFDASGAPIDASAPYATPVILTDTDQTLSTHLEIRNAVGPTAQVNGASDVVTFTYNGNPSVPSFMINATVGTTAVGSSGPIVPTTQLISFSNTFVDTGSKSDPNYGQPTIFFATVPASASTTASEVGYSGIFTAVLDPASCAGPVATLTGSPGTTFTATSVNPGVCKVIVSDTIGHASPFWISVTTGVIGINAHSRRIPK